MYVSREPSQARELKQLKEEFLRLKHEWVNRRQYRTRAEARADIFNYIELFDNPCRRRQLE